MNSYAPDESAMSVPHVTTCYKPGDKSRMKKEPYCNYNKRDIFEVICDTDIPERLTNFWWRS